MFCPKCGAQNESDVKFCRGCGQELTLVTKAMQKSTPIRIVGQFADELKLHKELQAKPSITRTTKFTVIGLFFLMVQFYFWISMGSRALFTLPNALWLLITFYFLGKGVKEFVKYRRSIAALDAREDNLELAPQNTETLDTTPLIPPSVTESSTTRALNTKESID